MRSIHLGSISSVSSPLLFLALVVPLVGCGASSGGAITATTVSANADGGVADSDASGVSSPTGGAGSLRISRMAYLRAAGGPELLVEGDAPGNDVALVHVDFFDAQGKEVGVDDGLGGYSTGADFDVKGANARFFAEEQFIAGFDGKVAQLRATPRSTTNAPGASSLAALGDPSVDADGQACGTLGFDVCVSGDVCAPGTAAGPNACTSDKAYRQASCLAAPALTLSGGAGTVIGTTQGVNLWDPPDGCVEPPIGGYGRPEGFATLHVTTAVASLTLTTASPATDTDTVLFVLPSCGDRGAVALACNDDTSPGVLASTLTLTEVAAGDYLVVVESVGASGGEYVLSVQSP